MGVSSRTVEITIISCENLRITEDPYVVVRAESLNCCTTNIAKDTASVSNKSTLFSWNQKLMLNIPMYAKSVTFQVQCNKLKTVRPVSVARIALSDLLNHTVLQNTIQLFSYRLRDWEGKPNGIIHFAVRVPPPEKSFNSTIQPAACKDSGDRFNLNDKKSTEVVVGVPFWWNYPNVV